MRYGKTLLQGVRYICLVTIVLFGLASIIGTGSSDDKGHREIKRLDIVDASSLFIASGSSGNPSRHTASRSVQNSGSEEGRLFKITADGYIEEVTYFDEDSKSITYVHHPSDIFNLNEAFVIVVFGDGASGYLVRKNDGAVFSLMNAGMPDPGFGTYLNWPRVQMDDNNNLYYLVPQDSQYTPEWLKRIVRINMNNPSSLTAEFISPSIESVDSFFVNQHGDVIYSGLAVDGRIFMAGGGLINTPHAVPYWLGADREFYAFDQFAGPDGTQIFKLTIEDRTLVEKEYGDPIDEMWWFMDYATKLTLQDKVYIVFDIGDVKGRVYEVYNPTATPRKVTGLSIYEAGVAVASDQYYYISGLDETYQPTLIKVYAPTNTPEIIMDPGRYDVYNMAVSPDDHLTFSALRMSDGKRVLGEIDSAGNLSILDEEADWEIMTLERIN